jgi:hypothetical protein
VLHTDDATLMSPPWEYVYMWNTSTPRWGRADQKGNMVGENRRMRILRHGGQGFLIRDRMISMVRSSRLSWILLT